MKLSISVASYVGCVRNNNEDMILVGDKFVRNGKHWTMVDTDACDRYMVAIADGMGGHNSGEVASSDVLHNLQFYFGDLPSGLSVEDYNEAIFEWLESINNVIDSKGRSDSRYAGMGTTLVAFSFYNKEFYWMSCGDSRFYRLHGNALQQVSNDHSLNNLTGDGHHSNVVTNCIGGGCKTSFLDMVQYTSDIHSGDVLLLCSDGLSNTLSEEELLSLSGSARSAKKACQALVNRALDKGARDNVSAAIAIF